MISIDTREAERRLSELKDQLSEKDVTTATRMALNEGIRKSRTEVRRSITDIYNIKPSRINDPNKKKGLSVKLAQGGNMSAELDAGHTPINLSEANAKFQGVTVANQVRYGKNGKASRGKAIKRSNTKISVEVIRGQRKTLDSAFTIGVATPASSRQQFSTTAIFARGKKGKPDFKFSKPRLPIDSMSTVSVATAALNTKAQQKVQPVVNAYVNSRLEYHLRRLINRASLS